LKLKIKTLLLALLVIGITLGLTAQAINVATYNIRDDNPGDIGNLWIDRAAKVSGLTFPRL